MARSRSAETRIGLLGIGHRARVFASLNDPVMGHVPASIVAAADPDPHAHERARGWLGEDIALYDSLEALLEHDGLDALVINTPDHLHAAHALAALEAGIPTYLEKPIAISTEDADAVLEAAERTGTPVYVGHNMRHMAVIRTMHEQIASGAIGEVKAIWCRHFVGNGGDFYFKDWHADRRFTTGLLLQKGAHDIDVIHHLAGAYTQRVVAMGGLTLYDRIEDRSGHPGQTQRDWFDVDAWPPLTQTGMHETIDVEDISMMLMELDGGIYASYEQCHYTPDYWRSYTVIGTEGRMENFGDGPGGHVDLWTRRISEFGDPDVSIPLVEEGEGHLAADLLIIAEWVDTLRHGGPTASSLTDARNAVAAGVAATTSLRSGNQPIDVPLLRTPSADADPA
ncbi:Gfo/Idh/MocA family protein [Brachybacterium tyrofermentans]|uniref:Gfo/Idh/MocA family protein n=1 Tax=Brachybacterium tyrofermentans TaxID=47848 RepID=UPI003FD1C1B5